MPQVQRFQSSCTTRDFAVAMILSWRALFQTTPTKEQAGVLWAHWMVETGGTAFWNFNVGNLKVTQAQVDADVPWYDLPGTNENIGDHNVVLRPGDPGRRFRAYSSLPEGMKAYLDLLSKSKFRTAWPTVLAGDPDGFARALKAQSYYTASVELYAGNMRAFHKRWLASGAFELALADVNAKASEIELPEPGPDSEPPTIVDDTNAIVHPKVPLPFDPEE